MNEVVVMDEPRNPGPAKQDTVSTTPLANVAPSETSSTSGTGAASTQPTAVRSLADPIVAKYPPARRDELVDTLHGVAVPDPYRWLEDPDAPETRAWIDAQNRISAEFLAGAPGRDAIAKRLERLWNYEKISVPTRKGDGYFYSFNTGLQNQSVIHWITVDDARTRALDANAKIVIDPNTLSADGTVAISTASASEDGRLFAYGLSRSGSDWIDIHVRDVETGEDLPDHVRWVKFSAISWRKDGSGFFYSRYPEPREDTKLQDVNRLHQLWFHAIGTAQADDVLIYERPDQPTWGFAGGVTDDDRYLVISVWEGSSEKNGVFYRDLSASGPIVELFRDFDAAYSVVHNEGSVFYVVTDKDAPRKRIVTVDVASASGTGPIELHEVVPEQDATLQSATAAGERLVLEFLENAKSKLEIRSLGGRLERIVDVPALGSVHSISARREDTEFFYSASSFIVPPTVYRYDAVTGVQTSFRQPRVEFDPTRFEVEQVFYSSKDGTRVPMFLAHRKGIARDGKRPVYLYGYGGFNIPITPAFSVPHLVWMELGGIYAIPNLRGGGEFGEAWHLAGTKLTKQNVFDDFIAAAEWLIAEKYTSPQRIAISGRSNGGLLVGACMVQRPDLFGAALPAVGVLDMLRFHKFTIGWAWTSDYGSADDPDEFRALHAYSPYHNVKAGTHYPATLVTTADHDDRVVPGHSFKFTAALQAAQRGPAPILIDIETKAGHGAGKPTSKRIEEWVDAWSFLVRIFGLEVPKSFEG
jgi:prolyl oligopeptidase